MRKIVCFHLYNDFSGSPKVLKVVLEGLLQRGCAVDLVTSRGGVLDNAQCIIHNSQLTPSATLVPLRQGDNIEGQQTTNNRQQLAGNSQLSILSPKAQRPSVLNSQLKYRYYDYRGSRCILLVIAIAASNHANHHGQHQQHNQQFLHVFFPPKWLSITERRTAGTSSPGLPIQDPCQTGSHIRLHHTSLRGYHDSAKW